MGNNGKVISFMNMKGGVCKTTLCVNIANTLATTYKKNVLVIDMDPQFNATQYILSVTKEDYMKSYKEIKDKNKTVYYLYSDKNKKKDADYREKEISRVGSLFNSKSSIEPYLNEDYIINIKENFDIIAGDIDLIEFQITQKDGISSRLSSYIEYNNLREKYDYILIDCAPTYSFYFISAYRASDTYIIPLKPDYVSSLGLALLEKAIMSIESGSKKINSCGIVYTLIDTRNKLHEPVIEDIEKSIGKEHIFKETMKYFTDVPRGVSEGNFMVDISNNDIDKSIKLITEEFISRLEEI